MATVCKMHLVGAVLALPERQMGAASGALTRFLAGLRPCPYTTFHASCSHVELGT